VIEAANLCGLSANHPPRQRFEVRQQSGSRFQVPWDLVLYHQEPRYAYHKGKASQREAEASGAARIGSRIRRAREAHGWSLADLTQRTGMHPPNLSRLESGKHVPSLDTLERVADALGIRVAALVAA
jgi:ribosome-binding protein aMBF1 (putative translation factor)